MPNRTNRVAASLTAGVSQRLRNVTGNAAILVIVALLALTVWIACIAGLVALLAPLWGIAMAFLIIALLVAVMALILLAVLQRRTRLQRARAEIHQAETRRHAKTALLAALPALMRNRSGALIVVSGLAIGAMVVAALQSKNDA